MKTTLLLRLGLVACAIGAAASSNSLASASLSHASKDHAALGGTTSCLVATTRCMDVSKAPYKACLVGTKPVQGCPVDGLKLLR